MAKPPEFFPPNSPEPPRPGEPVVLGLGGRDTARRLAAGDTAPPPGTRTPTSTEWAYLRQLSRRAVLMGAAGATVFLGLALFFTVLGTLGVIEAADRASSMVMLVGTLVMTGIALAAGVPLLMMATHRVRQTRAPLWRGVGRLRGVYILRSKPVRPEVNGTPVNMLREWWGVVRDGTHTFEVWPSLEEVPDRKVPRTVLAVVDLGLSIDTEVRSGGLPVRDWPVTEAEGAGDAG